MSRILLTGSSGFIGTRLLGHLRGAGHDVIGLDRDPARHTDVVDDLSDPSCVARVATAVGAVDVVAHFAGLSGSPRSLVEPASYFDSNVEGTRHALELAQVVGAGRMVLASSGAVYGDVDGPAAEDRALAPLSPYSESKMLAEELCVAKAAAGSMRSVVLRPFSVYGPGQPADMLCEHALRTVLAGQLLEVWEWQRDFTYIDEVCRAAAAAMVVPVDDPFRAYNLGSGRPIAARQFVQTLERVTKLPVTASFVAPEPGEPAVTFADTDRARGELGLRHPGPFVVGLDSQRRSMVANPAAAAGRAPAGLSGALERVA